jgi:hypothetical protein
MVHRCTFGVMEHFIFYFGVMELWKCVSSPKDVSPSISHLQPDGIQKSVSSVINIISQVTFYPFPNQYHILRF